MLPYPLYQEWSVTARCCTSFLNICYTDIFFILVESCGRPEVKEPHNVMLMGNRFKNGDKVMFMCRFGFTPIKVPPILTCQSNGKWNGEAKCIGKD